VKRLVVAVAVALVFAAGCGKEDTLSTSSGTTTTAASAPATGELVFFNPTWLPAGVTVGDVSVQRGEQETPSWAAKLGRADGRGKFTDIVTAIVSRAETRREVGEREEEESRNINVNGHDALANDSEFGAAVSWSQDGCDVGVLGKSGASDEVLDVARRLHVPPGGHPEATQLDGVPAGMEVIASWGHGAYPRTRYLMSALAEERGGESVHIDVTVVPVGFPLALMGAGYESDATRDVRGHGADLFRQSNSIGGQPLVQMTLAWAERPDLMVSIGGTITDDEAQKIAAGLREETEQKWRSHFTVRD
jgi:hypothetical protein